MNYYIEILHISVIFLLSLIDLGSQTRGSLMSVTVIYVNLNSHSCEKTEHYRDLLNYKGNFCFQYHFNENLFCINRARIWNYKMPLMVCVRVLIQEWVVISSIPCQITAVKLDTVDFLSNCEWKILFQYY